MSARIRAAGPAANRYAAPPGRRERGRRNMLRSACAQGPGSLGKGRSSGQHVVDQQAGNPEDAGPPSRLHLHRPLEVDGPLAMVQPGLVGDPTPKSQRRGEDQLTLGECHLTKGRTRQQLQGCIAAPADSSGRGWCGNNEHRAVAAGQDRP